jgi:DNA-binding CsgD family transcriptional regulator
MCLIFLGDLHGARGYLTHAAVFFEEIGSTHWASNALAMLGFHAHLQGRGAEARVFFNRALTYEDPFNTVFVLPLLALSAFEDGDVGPAEDCLRELGRQRGTFGDSHLGVWSDAMIEFLTALHLEVVGDQAGARASAAAAARGFPPTLGAMFCQPAFTLAALLDRRAGEHASAEAILAEGIELISDQRGIVFAPDMLDATAALRADVGSDADGARMFAAARRGRQEMGTVPQFRSAWDVGSEIDVLRARMGEEAFASAWAEGEGLSLEDALAYALRGRGPRQRPQAGWDGLTPTELKVVELVAEGLSNPQVAERLIMSPRTVSTHLSHVFAKLGVSSRGELAAAALKRTSS